MVVDSDARELVAFAEGIRARGEFMPLEDPVQAVEHIARFQPDVVICPIAMPGWDGLQLIEMLRGNPRLAHIQMAFLAGALDDPPLRQFAEHESRRPLLNRPVTPEAVAALLEQILSAPGFVVREKRTTYGEFVRDVLKRIEQQKESRRRRKEREAHLQHLSGWAQFLAREMKEPHAPGGKVAGRTARDYYLS